jgi:type III pantothenate kinase
MILALDVGNSNVYGGVFEGDQLRIQFRKSSTQGFSSDEFGLFLRAVLRENSIDPARVRTIAICTVVPDVIHSLRNCCKKYFGLAPFVLGPGVRTGLNIRYRNPLEVGADRIANAISATHLHPGRDLIVVDFGTATTFCAISAEREYLGGVIVAGLRISMEALESKTAKLPSVEILVPESVVGKGTVESIQSGLYYGNVGIVNELVKRISEESFGGRRPLVIGTGGFASLFEKAGIFDVVIPDLVLKGLFLAVKLNL